MTQRRPFLPTARQINWLLIVGFLAVGYAFYLRYLVIEQPTVGLACDAGLATWLCFTRKVVTALFGYSVLGALALGLALLHLARPSMALLLPALAAAGFGIVLYNTGLSSLATALLIVSFARPQNAAA
jgi:hypothetical protein